tara:strand:+ start:12214 stop:13563 length:1350 start_codon:yes stop_codon:yes gene_type:complete
MEKIEKDFDEIILKDKSKFINKYKWMSGEFNKKNLRVNDKILPSYFKPFFISTDFEKRIKIFSETVNHILKKVTRLCVEKENFRSLLLNNDVLEELFLADPGYDKNTFIIRLDTFIRNNNIKVIEFNTDSPGEHGRSDLQNEIFLKSGVMNGLTKKYKINKVSIVASLLDGILDCYKNFGGENKKPVIAITSWKSPPSYYPEHVIIKDFFNKKGIKTIICSLDELKYKRGAVFYKSTKVDIVHRRVVSEDISRNITKIKDFIRAYENGDVFVINNFRSIPAGNKKLLSFLQQKIFDNYLTNTEKSIIRENIPQTMDFDNENAYYKGEKVDLKRFLEKNKGRFVIKPNEGFGGKGVFVGKECSKTKWQKIIKKAFKEKTYVAQEFIKFPTMDFPIVKNNKVVFEKRNLNINPFVINDKFVSCLTRASPSSIINISSGGAMVPTFFYRKRK